MAETFEAMLTGGHPNSLGRTVEVVEAVLQDRERLEDLFACYRSEDEVVRLRVSSAMKRIEAVRRDWLVPYLDRFIDEIGNLDQPSAQWTLAQLFARMENELDADQRARALAILKRNLAQNHDWIVLNMTMETLTGWASENAALRAWLLPHLKRLAEDDRKSVRGRATKFHARLRTDMP